MSFFEVQFPTTISYKAVGGPGLSTTINKGFSGQEQRNKNRTFSRGKWTVSLLTPSSVDDGSAGPTSRQQFIDLLLAFFLVVGGRADSFRLKDHKDFKFTGEAVLGAVDGTNTIFQLVKRYTIGGRTYTRTIYKPITSAVTDYLGNALANTVVVKDNGTPVVSGISIDATTGLVTFTTAPSLGHAITADGQFHFPVRFDTDDLPMQLEESDVAGGQALASVNSITLIETLAPNF